MSDVPCMTYMTLYILSLHVLQTNSKGSTLWRLNFEDGKIVQADNFPKTLYPSDPENDPIFEIITSTVHVGHSWTKTGDDSFCNDCQQINIASNEGDSSTSNSSVTNSTSNSTSDKIVGSDGTQAIDEDLDFIDDHIAETVPEKHTTSKVVHATGKGGAQSGKHAKHNKHAKLVKQGQDGGKSARSASSETHTSGRTATLTAPNGTIVNSTAISIDDDEFLDCGKPVNFTYYDNLLGISNRHTHPNVPEPKLELIFKRKVSKDYDVNSLERKLKKAKREKPKSVQLYNQIGNFWRIKGETLKSIECFRRALAVSPHNPEVLLNLARVMFNLQYLDDSIYLTRRSLEVQPPDKNAWQQYFTLGEIFKAYGHYQEAALHLRHSLELKPDFELSVELLKDMESIPESTIHIYTLLIILCLVLGVLLVILSNVDAKTETEFPENRAQRHFNRAVAMRSIRLGITSRGFRSRSKNGGNNNSGG